MTKNIACTGKSVSRENMMDYSDISVPILDKRDDSDLVSGIIEQPLSIRLQIMRMS